MKKNAIWRLQFITYFFLSMLEHLQFDKAQGPWSYRIV